MRCERESHAFVRREELLETKMRKFECFGQHDVFLIDAVGTMQQVAGIELEQAT